MAIITPLKPQDLLSTVLPALPPAAVSTEPASGLLPLLSPILRQRVQLLADASTEPWLRLLCYDVAKAAKLGAVVSGGNLDPHPVSGEVEVDWDYDVEMRYRRLDEETLQALVVMATFGLAFQLVWCINDEAGGGDGWRLGEVTVPDEPSPFGEFGGSQTLGEAESRSSQAQTSRKTTPRIHGDRLTPLTPLTPAVDPAANANNEAEDDDGYWAQYDATPGRTPDHSTKPSPAPQSMRNNPGADDEYFSRYDEVQPAMDNHDPDEEPPSASPAAPLGLGAGPSAHVSSETPRVALADPSPDEVRRAAGTMHHPRPESSASSQGSGTVAKLEATAGKQEQSEFGVKQHVSRSIRSLFMLSRASGIEREDFEQLVKTELDLLGMMEEGS